MVVNKKNCGTDPEKIPSGTYCIDQKKKCISPYDQTVECTTHKRECTGPYKDSPDCTKKNLDCLPPFKTGDKQPSHCKTKQNNCETPYDTDKECKETAENCRGEYETTEECKTHKKNCTGPYEGRDECGVEINYRKNNANTRSGGVLFVIALLCLTIVIGVLFYLRSISSSDNATKVGTYIIGKFNKFITPILTAENAQYWIIISLYITLVAGIIIIIVTAYDIKRSYELGANFEKQCDGVFIEKERADFHAYSCYNAINDYDTELGIYSNKRGAIKDRFKRAYGNCLSAIVTTILVVVLLYTAIKIFYVGLFIRNPQQKQVLTITSFYKNFEYKDTKGDLWGFVLFLVAMAVCLITLLSLWIEGNKQEKSLNPYSDIVYEHATDTYYKSDKIKNIVRNHYTYLVLILIVVVFSLLGCNFEMNGIPEISTTVVFMVVGLIVSLIIIIPLFIKSAQAFQLNISKNYTDATISLNNAIIDYKNNNNWDSLRKELEKNITLDDRANSHPESELSAQIDLLNSSTFKKYEKRLYMYLPHILDNNHIRGVSIPQELKSILETKYLAGELSIEMKEEFIKTYYRHKDNNDKITKESLENSDKNLLPYLKNSVRIKIFDKRGNKEIGLLNKHILLNDNFKKGNPLPGEIIRKLELMRKDTTIKKTVENYFSSINMITSLILIFIAYYIYHNIIYPNDVDIKIQYVSMLIFIIMLILGIIGWWMKELWL